MSVDLAEFRDAFRDEAREHVQALGLHLLELERRPDDPAPIRAMFLSAHSLKSAAALLGLAASRELAHAMEDVLAAARGGRLRFDAETIQLLFQAVDRLADLIAAATGAVEPGDVVLADRLRPRPAAPPAPPAPPAGRPGGAPPDPLVQ